MSELRQRGGKKEIVKAGPGSGDIDVYEKPEAPEVSLYMGGAANFKDEDLEDIIRSSVLPKDPYRMPSYSNRAQAAKDRLAEDANNMELIRDLGFIFCSEVQWDLAANVLVRGMKRSNEFPDPKDRFMFLMKLAEASFKNKKFRQAEAVLKDITVPDEDGPEKKAWQLLACHTYCELDKQVDALKVFNEAVKSTEFEDAIKLWAACALSLRKVGAFDVAKNTIMNKARSGPHYQMDQGRMQTIESWAVLSTTPKAPLPMWSLEDGLQPWMKKSLISVLCFIIFVILYILEKRSLAKLKLN